MSKPFIELISCETGDWEVLKYKTKNDKDYISIEGHSISNWDWIELLKHLGYEVKKTEISDEDMENGNY